MWYLASGMKVKFSYQKAEKRFKDSRRYHKVRLKYQGNAGFSHISQIGRAWAPKRFCLHVHSHYIREYRYCYSAVGAHMRESFL